MVDSMTSSAELQQQRAELAKGLERERRALQQFAAVIGSMTGFAGLFFGGVLGMHLLLSLALGAVGFALGFMVTRLMRMGDFVQKYKLEIIKPYLEAKFPGMEYFPYADFDPSEVLASCLFPVASPELTMEDGVHGVFAGLALSAAEINVCERRHNNDLVSVYRGVFGTTTHLKKLRSGIIVFSKDYPLKPGRRLSQFAFDKDLQLVQLELPAFHDRFDVWAVDNIEAHYALPISFQEKIVELHKSMGAGMAFSILGDRVALTVKASQDYCEPNQRDFTDQSQLVTIVEQLEAILAALRVVARPNADQSAS